MARPRKNPKDRYRTPVRSVRVPDDIWVAAKAEAEARGETISEAIVAMLERYGRAHRR